MRIDCLRELKELGHRLRGAQSAKPPAMSNSESLPSLSTSGPVSDSMGLPLDQPINIARNKALSLLFYEKKQVLRPRWAVRR